MNSLDSETKDKLTKRIIEIWNENINSDVKKKNKEIK